MVFIIQSLPNTHVYTIYLNALYTYLYTVIHPTESDFYKGGFIWVKPGVINILSTAYPQYSAALPLTTRTGTLCFYPPHTSGHYSYIDKPLIIKHRNKKGFANLFCLSVTKFFKLDVEVKTHDHISVHMAYPYY